jgi:hypothetical protein
VYAVVQMIRRGATTFTRPSSRSWLVVPAVSLLLALLAAAPASAQGAPIGGCPTGFDFLYLVSELPPTAGLQSVDVNGDGWTCVNLIAFDNPHGIRFAAVDDVSSVPVP